RRAIYFCLSRPPPGGRLHRLERQCVVAPTSRDAAAIYLAGGEITRQRTGLARWQSGTESRTAHRGHRRAGVALYRVARRPPRPVDMRRILYAPADTATWVDDKTPSVVMPR